MFLRSRHVKLKLLTLLIGRVAQIGQSVKILKMFHDADNNGKGISSKYTGNFMASSKKAKFTYVRLH